MKSLTRLSDLLAPRVAPPSGSGRLSLLGLVTPTQLQRHFHCAVCPSTKNGCSQHLESRIDAVNNMAETKREVGGISQPPIRQSVGGMGHQLSDPTRTDTISSSTCLSQHL